MKKNKSVALYSAFFPFYGFIAGNWKDIPWMMAANFGILAIVTLVVLLIARVPDKKSTLGKVVGRAFGVSLLTDAVGMVFRFLPLLTEMFLRLIGAEKAAWYLAVNVSEFTWYQIWGLNWNFIGLPWTIGSILAAGVFAYFFNYHVALKHVVPDKKVRRALSIVLAVFSAPYSWTNPAW